MHFEFICTVDCFKIKHVFCLVACTFEFMYRCSLRNREDVRICSLIKALLTHIRRQNTQNRDVWCGHGLYPFLQAIPFCDRELRSVTLAWFLYHISMISQAHSAEIAQARMHHAPTHSNTHRPICTKLQGAPTRKKDLDPMDYDPMVFRFSVNQHRHPHPPTPKPTPTSTHPHPSTLTPSSCDGWVAAGGSWYTSQWPNWSDLAMGGSRLAFRYL